LLSFPFSVVFSVDAPQGNLVEVRFQDLEHDMVAETRRIYTALGWPGYEESARPHVENYAQANATYRKNELSTLSPAVRKIIRARWGPSFEAFGY
jgi:hypothetical protein